MFLTFSPNALIKLNTEPIYLNIERSIIIIVVMTKHISEENVSTVPHLPVWTNSTISRINQPRHPQGSRSYCQRMETTLGDINKDWTRKYGKDESSKTPTQPDNTRRVSFPHESAATLLFLDETESTSHQTTKEERRQLWKEFMLLVWEKRVWKKDDDGKLVKGDDGEPVEDSKANMKLHLLMDICHDCRDRGMEFTFGAIEGHAWFYCFAGRLSRYTLATWFDSVASGIVYLYCPLEQESSGGYEPFSATVAPSVLRQTPRYTPTNGIRIDEKALEFGQRWELFYGCIAESGLFTTEDESKALGRMAGYEADYPRRRHRPSDCVSDYVKRFCRNAKWPRQVIDDILAMFCQAQENQQAQLSNPIPVDVSPPEPQEVIAEPDVETCESVVAEPESLNVIQREPAAPAVVKPKPANIDDTLPLGHEWHIDEKNRRVRRSLRIRYKKQRTEC